MEKELKRLTVPANRNRHRASRNSNLSQIATAPLQKLVNTSSLLFEGHHLSERIPTALALEYMTVIITMGTVTPVGARHRGLTPTPRPAPHSPGGGAIPPLTDEERGGTCGGIWQQPHAPADRTPPAWGPESGARTAA